MRAAKISISFLRKSFCCKCKNLQQMPEENAPFSTGHVANRVFETTFLHLIFLEFFHYLCMAPEGIT